MRSYQIALALDASNPYASYNLGKLCLAQGAGAEAESLLRRAVRARSSFAEAHVLLARLLEDRGDLEASLAALEDAAAARPGYFAAQFYRGLVLRKLGRDADAQRALGEALALEPENRDAKLQLALSLKDTSRWVEVEPLLLQVLEGDAARLDAAESLCDLYIRQGRLQEALSVLERTLRMRPDWTEGRFHYALALTNVRRPDDAEAELRSVIEAEPRHAEAYRVLVSVLLGQGRSTEAAEVCAAACRVAPDRYDLASLELFARNFSDQDSAAELYGRHRRLGERIEGAISPLPERHRAADDRERRLRIGYMAGEFHRHVVAQFLLPLLEHHDRERFEIHGYFTGIVQDGVTKEVSSACDAWHEVTALSEAALAQSIRDDRIDLLVDLSAHAGVVRIGTIARRPAPVQASWLGYLNTTGTTRMDYRITDRHADPEGVAERFHTERLVRLPHSQWCYRPFATVAPAAAPPCLQNEHVTFGSFNHASKISDTTCLLWAEILRRLPDARLHVVGIQPGRAQSRLLALLARGGVSAARISLAPYLDLEPYYRSFDRVDIALDTTPYSGGTTSCDTLWMGVPIVTLAGERSASRSAASVVTTVGEGGWIARTSDDYVAQALQLASDRQRLRELRGTLRARVQASPLMDETGFARDLESAYRCMWQTWCEAREATQ